MIDFGEILEQIVFVYEVLHCTPCKDPSTAIDRVVHLNGSCVSFCDTKYNERLDIDKFRLFVSFQFSAYLSSSFTVRCHVRTANYNSDVRNVIYSYYIFPSTLTQTIKQLYHTR